MSDSREAFEKWAEEELDEYDFSKYEGGDYCEENTENMWQAWQASRQESESSEMACIKTLVDVRFACGDDGKRMQGDLVDYIAELSRKAGAGDGQAVSVPESWHVVAKSALNFVAAGISDEYPLAAAAHIKGLAELLLSLPTKQEQGQ